jgi:hypothetical protein
MPDMKCTSAALYGSRTTGGSADGFASRPEPAVALPQPAAAIRATVTAAAMERGSHRGVRFIFMGQG